MRESVGVENFVNTMSQKLVKGISPNFGHITKLGLQICGLDFGVRRPKGKFTAGNDPKINIVIPVRAAFTKNQVIYLAESGADTLFRFSCQT